MTEMVGKAPTPTEKFLGIGPTEYKHTQLSKENLKECKIPASEVPVWQPSPSDPEKGKLYLKIANEVRRQAGIAGWHIQRAFCNDFNVRDPIVYAVVDGVDADGVASRMLMMLELSRRDDGNAFMIRADTGDAIPRSTLERILAGDPLSIDFGKRGL